MSIEDKLHQNKDERQLQLTRRRIIRVGSLGLMVAGFAGVMTEATENSQQKTELENELAKKYPRATPDNLRTAETLLQDNREHHDQSRAALERANEWLAEDAARKSEAARRNPRHNRYMIGPSLTAIGIGVPGFAYGDRIYDGIRAISRKRRRQTNC